jgi:hypothetical protein
VLISSFTCGLFILLGIKGGEDNMNNITMDNIFDINVFVNNVDLVINKLLTYKAILVIDTVNGTLSKYELLKDETCVYSEWRA